MNKLYVGNKGIPYSRTEVNANRSKAMIDEILRKYGITKIGWDFDPDNNNVVLHFQISEKFKNREIRPMIRVAAPYIWDRQTRSHPERINWRVSLRILHWYVKTSLEMAYAMQSERILAFLPHVEVTPDETVKDIVVPRLGDLETLKKLPPPVNPSKGTRAKNRSPIMSGQAALGSSRLDVCPCFSCAMPDKVIDLEAE